MRTRLGILAAVALLLLLAGALVPVAFPRPSPVSKAACARIEEGMSLAEVEAILGGPPGDYATRPILPWPSALPDDSPQVGEWQGDEVVVQLGFHAGGVRSKDLTDVEPDPVSAWDL